MAWVPAHAAAVAAAATTAARPRGRCATHIELRTHPALNADECEVRVSVPLFEQGLDDDAWLFAKAKRTQQERSVAGSGAGVLGSCAVVSGSGELAGSRCGRRIDANDIVIRINDPPVI